ncbi:addiction module protein [Sorangium sp. So ce513]|uniref:addiction module protein n=2 Tax=unclassified Sorangium TaxID=2621164 RepID=UPI003F60DF83
MDRSIGGASQATLPMLMAHPTQDLLAAALSLPEGERLRLASELIASVEEPYDDAWNAAWLEELERREQAVRDGGSEGNAWAEVRARILARLGAG